MIKEYKRNYPDETRQTAGKLTPLRMPIRKNQNTSNSSSNKINHINSCASRCKNKNHGDTIGRNNGSSNRVVAVLIKFDMVQ